MSYAWYITGTIDHTKVGGSDQANFVVPVYIAPNAIADLKSVANGGKVQSSSGFDIRPRSGDRSTSFSYQLRKYDPTTGELAMMMQHSNVTHAVDPLFALTFGDSALTTDGSSTATWDSSFDGVYPHENGTTLNGNDATVNANTATVTGATAATGKLSGGANFASSTDSIVTPASSVFARVGAVTIATWAKFAAIGSGENSMMVERDDDNVSWGVALELDTANARFQITNNGPTTFHIVGSTTLSTGTWYRIVAVYDAPNTQILLYVNGASDATPVAASGSLRVPGASSDYTFGKLGHQGGRAMQGVLDETYIMNVVRSADWVTADWNSQNSPSTFISYSATFANASPSLRGIYEPTYRRQGWFDALMRPPGWFDRDLTDLAWVSTATVSPWESLTDPQAARVAPWESLTDPKAARVAPWENLTDPSAGRTCVWESLTDPSAARVAPWESLTDPKAARVAPWENLTDPSAGRVAPWESLARPAAGRTAPWESLSITVIHIVCSPTMPNLLDSGVRGGSLTDAGNRAATLADPGTRAGSLTDTGLRSATIICIS